MNGTQVGDLSAEAIAYREQMSETGHDFKVKSYVMMGTTVAFAAIGVPLLYRWLRGERPSAEAPVARGTASSWSLLPSLTAQPGFTLHATF
jgi:hypothetical protein